MMKKFTTLMAVSFMTVSALSFAGCDNTQTESTPQGFENNVDDNITNDGTMSNPGMNEENEESSNIQNVPQGLEDNLQDNVAEPDNVQ